MLLDLTIPCSQRSTSARKPVLTDHFSSLPFLQLPSWGQDTHNQTRSPWPSSPPLGRRAQHNCSIAAVRGYGSFSPCFNLSSCCYLHAALLSLDINAPSLYLHHWTFYIYPPNLSLSPHYSYGNDVPIFSHGGGCHLGLVKEMTKRPSIKSELCRKPFSKKKKKNQHQN